MKEGGWKTVKSQKTVRTDVKWSSGQVVSFINYQQPWSPAEAKMIKATVDWRQYLASPILGYIGLHVSCYKSSESLLLDEALQGGTLWLFLAFLLLSVSMFTIPVSTASAVWRSSRRFLGCCDVDSLYWFPVTCCKYLIIYSSSFNSILGAFENQNFLN